MTVRFEVILLRPPPFKEGLGEVDLEFSKIYLPYPSLKREGI